MADPHTNSRYRNLITLVLALAIIGALAYWATLEMRDKQIANPVTNQQTHPNPQPWEYDEVNDRHWNAEPGHNHWHPGPPPQLAPSHTVSAPTVTPEPWEYDEANDQHWFPEHNHWHPGPPPPPDQR